MRIFVKMRQWALNHQELAHKLQSLEATLEEHRTAIETLFDTIDELSNVKLVPPRVPIGFK